MSWGKHFDIPDPFPSEGIIKLKCIHCGILYSGNAKSTSNFSTHIKRKHRNMLLADAGSDQKPSTSIQTFINSPKATKYGPQDKRQKEGIDLLVYYISGTLTPFSVVESAQFKEFVNFLDPRFQIPDRHVLASKHLTSVFLETEKKLKSLLQAADSICITLDIWSNRQMRGFLGITGHFVVDWQMKNVMIACKRFKGRHTGKKNRQEYEECCMQYNISDKVTNIICDNASNMKKAFSISLPGCTETPKCEQPDTDSDSSDNEIESDKQVDDDLMDEFPTCTLGHCFAHTLQLVVKDGLKEINQYLKTVIAKASALVKFVRKSVLASEILEGEKRLQTENTTRWNSQVAMIRSVLAITEEKLNNVGAPVQIKYHERKLLKELLIILEPFEEAPIMVQVDKTVTSSLVVPVVLGLQHKMDEISKTFSNKMTSTLKGSIEKRLTPYVTNETYVVAALLDPSIKQRWCSSNEDMEEKLVHYAKKMKETCGHDSDEVLSPPEKKVKTEGGGLLSFMSPKTKRVRSKSGDQVKIEVQHYFKEPCVEKMDSLSFWQENETTYPLLSKVAKRFLCVQATSAPVERLFSVAGKFFRPERCRLDNNTFQKLMMIKCNSKM